uniref:Uncharacterized protein n=1 Tax=Ditylenchus dipsaci TaxID=166011 RepID=A0A915EBG6_9BILA
MIESWKRDVSGVDSVKRAYVESLSEQYGVFANLVDEIRMGHISRTAVYSISNALVFLSQWHDRINYLQKLTAVTSKELAWI